ncbi:uncharacterized protein DNG_07955 [Cephalotrichum gorgonifer]|uniref:Uncharacterized protein n=1 Tax=Cephalotrichum gorgonifer TaxID=2041049 RepID=A0AAE8N4T0_9PEZI|nr:uncharacterized protein DNG_07955 [Cephalotrichum gorgonifer]
MALAIGKAADMDSVIGSFFPGLQDHRLPLPASLLTPPPSPRPNAAASNIVNVKPAASSGLRSGNACLPAPQEERDERVDPTLTIYRSTSPTSQVGSSVIKKANIIDH